MKHLIFGLFVLTSFSAISQDSQPQDSIPLELRKQAFIYEMGLKYNDPTVSRMALYNILALNTMNTAILDSLAISYFDYQQYASAALVAQDAIAINPDNLFATEIAAICFESLGVKDRAVTYYEKLYLSNNGLSTLYKIAFLQLDLKRYGEAGSSADIIFADAESESVKLLFPISQTEQQEISMKAAALRIKGMIAEAQGDSDKALTEYNKALSLEPDFFVLKEQIKELTSK